METLAGLLAEDVVWHQAGEKPMAGEYRGRGEVLSWLGELETRTEGPSDSRPTMW